MNGEKYFDITPPTIVQCRASQSHAMYIQRVSSPPQSQFPAVVCVLAHLKSIYFVNWYFVVT